MRRAATAIALVAVTLAARARAQMPPEELDRLIQRSGSHDDAGADAATDAAAPLYDEPGPPIELRALRPAGAASWPRACSMRHPLCVHGPVPSIAATLAAADAAWDVETGALALPAPDAGSTGAYDIYLVPDVTGGGATLLDARDAAARFDRASAFSLIDRSVPAGCALDVVVAREVARASLFRAAPATGEATARAETEIIARLVAPCAAADVTGAMIFERFDFRPIFDPLRDANPAIADDYERGAALFYGWLDAVYGRAPGGVVRALWALSPTVTPLGAWHWHAEPDAWDVLATTFKGALGPKSTLDDLLVKFAVARAFAGQGGDDDLPDAARLGDAARARFDWDVPWPTSPRSLASPNAVGPTGAAYIAIRTPPKGARLTIGAEWEEHARMRWTVVKVRASGEPYATLPINGLDRGTQAWLEIDNLDDADALVVVGVNVGDPWLSYDPDEEIFTPHGWLLKMAPK